MLSQVGSITTNGVQQQTIFRDTPLISLGVPGAVWPGVVTSPYTVDPYIAGSVSNLFPCFSGVRDLTCCRTLAKFSRMTITSAPESLS